MDDEEAVHALRKTPIELPGQVRREGGPQRHGRQEDNGPADKATREVRVLALERLAEVR